MMTYNMSLGDPAFGTLVSEVDQLSNTPSLQVIYQSSSYTIHVLAGDPLSLAQTINGDARGSAMWYGDVNFGSTANTEITVLTPGATLTSASGVDYSPQATPEPTALILLSTGLGVIGLTAWRKRK